MNIGDIVVYPMHGAGIIDSIEDSEIGGMIKSYYILKLPIGNLKLMLPVDNIDQLGLRDVINKDKLDKVATVLKEKPEHSEGSWNKRFQATLDRMKSGDILDVAAVARNLSLQYRKRKISSGERRLMELSRQILISELIYVLEKNSDEVAELVDKIILNDENISEQTDDSST